MRLGLTLAALAMTCGHALASGGASCHSEGGPADISIQAGVTRGMGSPVFSMEAKVAVKDDKAPEDLRASAFSKDQMTQYWFDGGKLSFVFYRERTGETFGSVETTVTTDSAGDDVTYAGKYRVSVFDTTNGSDEPPIVYEGAIRCEVE